MKVVEMAGRADLAQVFVVQMRDTLDSLVECVGAVDPSVPRSEKMVVVVSTQLGCPVGCAMCDAGTAYHGNLTAPEIQAQIDLVLEAWAGAGASTCRKLKVQFARMGEPALNPAVLDVIEALGQRDELPGLLPCIATTAPVAGAAWLRRLIEVRNRWFDRGRFQIQISVQSTCEETRQRMIPIAKWSLAAIAAFARETTRATDRKVTLNFALAQGVEVSADRLGALFDPRVCLVKLTPLNPTEQAARSGLSTAFEPGTEERIQSLVRDIRAQGFECVVSMGLPEESEMSTSCGQLARIGRQRAPGRPRHNDIKAPAPE